MSDNTTETLIVMPAEPSREVILSILAWCFDRSAAMKYGGNGIAKMIYLSIRDALQREQNLISRQHD